MTHHGKYETKILVLDDERLIRLAVCARLKSAGYDSVSVGTVQEAVSILKAHHRSFSAIISDIMMGDMDGFVFRDIVRGIDDSIPFFFMTALDPEEGSGFLKKILSDPNSYYLPKSVKVEVLLKRVQSIVALRRVEQYIERQQAESRQALALAAHVQRNMLPVRAQMTDQMFFVYDAQVKTRKSDTGAYDYFCLSSAAESGNTNTLVLQSYDKKNVKIILEFENRSGKKFMGHDGIVYPGTKFYLIGEVNPVTAETDLTDENKDRVFTQDYITTFMVRVNSFENAYNVMPDLLAPRMEIGVEVPNWQTIRPTTVELQK